MNDSRTHNPDGRPCGRLFAFDRAHHPGSAAECAIAKLRTKRGETLCRVFEISERGLTAELSPPPAGDERVTLLLHDDWALPCRVTWQEGERVGLAFDTPQHIETLSRELTGAGPSARPVRIAAEGFATVSHGMSKSTAEISNISERGLCLLTREAFDPGIRITLDVHGLGRLTGMVRWSSEVEAGIALDSPIAFDRLAHWIWASRRAQL